MKTRTHTTPCITVSSREFMTGDNKTYQKYSAASPADRAALEIEATYTKFLVMSDIMPSVRLIASIIVKHYKEYEENKDKGESEAEFIDRIFDAIDPLGQG